MPWDRTARQLHDRSNGLRQSDLTDDGRGTVGPRPVRRGKTGRPRGTGLRAVFDGGRHILATAEAWFVGNRWPGGPRCPRCGNDNIQTNCLEWSRTFRCRRRSRKMRFSVRKGTVMESSNLDCRIWAIAIYLCLTSLKSVSSMKLHRALDITQKSAWHPAHRIREVCEDEDIEEFFGPVEADEAYFGGKRANMSNAKRQELRDQWLGRGASGKTAVVGVKDREANSVTARVVGDTKAETLQGFVDERIVPETQVYTDDSASCTGIDRPHESVRHPVGEYVRGMARTNGIESFWAMLRRARDGTFHKMPPKHLQRYVNETAGRHSIREAGTIAQIRHVSVCMTGQRLRYGDLIGDNGLDNGARKE